MDEQSITEYYNKGLEYIKAGNWDEAIEYLNKALAENPKHVNSHNALGKAYHNKGDVEAARRCWRTALRIDPDNVTAIQNLDAARGPILIPLRTLLWVAAVVVLVLLALIITNGILLRRTSSLKTELELARAAAFDNQNPESENQISGLNVQDETRQEDQPMPSLESAPQAISKLPPAAEAPAIKMPPATSTTSSELIEIYAQALADCRTGWYKQAIQGFQKVLAYSPDHILKDNAQYWMSECYYAQKDYSRALTEFQKVKKYFPKGNKVFDAELKIAYTYYSMKRMEQAKLKLSQISKDWPRQQYQVQIDALDKKIRSWKPG